MRSDWLSDWLSEWLSEWQGHLLSCLGTAKKNRSVIHRLTVTVIELQGSCFVKSERWFLHFLHQFERHLSIWSCSVFASKCFCLFCAIWTPSVWHPAEPQSTKRRQLHRCVKNCEELVGWSERWFEDAGHKGWDTVVPWLSLISLPSQLDNGKHLFFCNGWN